MNTKLKLQHFLAAGCVAALLGLTGFVLADHAVCPAQGSGAAGVAAWGVANCGDCADTATTCNHEFTIELTDWGSGTCEGCEDCDSCVFFEYEVCRLEGSPSGLSHWEYSLGHICVDEENGFTIHDLVKCATLNGVPVNFTLGLDPTTQLVGVKIDIPAGTDTGVGSCLKFCFSLDQSVLEEGQSLVAGCVLAATKAGNQDITRTNRRSPGYACIMGPVCEESKEGTGCTPGYWKTSTPRDRDYSHWPTGTHPDDLLASVFDVFPDDCVLADGIVDGTLLEALNFGGGSGLDGGARILLRAGVAAYLNAQLTEDGCGNYPLNVDQVIGAVNLALASCERDTMIAVAAALDALNNLGCPQNAHGECLDDEAAEDDE